MSKSNKKNTSTKSTDTRIARKSFEKRYGEVSSGVVRLLATGYTTSEVSDITGAPKTTVATYKANLTRGAYAPYVYGNGSGHCNFKA